MRAGIGTAVLAAVLGASAAAGINPTTAEWNVQLKEIAALVRSGDYERARNGSLRVTEELVRRLGTGKAAAEFLGRAVGFRALAEAGLGRPDDAVWYWEVAKGIHPSLDDAELEKLGAAGTALAAAIATEHTCCLPDLADAKARVIDPPRVLDRKWPKFPRGAASFGVEGLLIVEVVIDAKGRVRRPMVRQALPAPSLTYVALESLKRYRVEPARADGKPIPVFYNLSVNFILR